MSSKNNKIKKMTSAHNEFHKTLSLIQEFNIEPNSLQKLKSIQMLLDLSHEKKSQNKKSVISLVILIVILVLGYNCGFHTREGFTRIWFWWSRIYDKENTFCTISMPTALQNALMPRFDCKTCSQLEDIPKVANLTPNEFSKRQVLYQFFYTFLCSLSLNSIYILYISCFVVYVVLQKSFNKNNKIMIILIIDFFFVKRPKSTLI